MEGVRCPSVLQPCYTSSRCSQQGRQVHRRAREDTRAPAVSNLPSPNESSIRRAECGALCAAGPNYISPA